MYICVCLHFHSISMADFFLLLVCPLFVCVSENPQYRYKPCLLFIGNAAINDSFHQVHTTNQTFPAPNQIIDRYRESFLCLALDFIKFRLSHRTCGGPMRPCATPTHLPRLHPCPLRCIVPEVVDRSQQDRGQEHCISEGGSCFERRNRCLLDWNDYSSVTAGFDCASSSPSNGIMNITVIYKEWPCHGEIDCLTDRPTTLKISAPYKFTLAPLSLTVGLSRPSALHGLTCVCVPLTTPTLLLFLFCLRDFFPPSFGSSCFYLPADWQHFSIELYSLWTPCMEILYVFVLTKAKMSWTNICASLYMYMYWMSIHLYIKCWSESWANNVFIQGDR